MELNPELDLIIERMVDISPELMWKAWTTPSHLMKWFTPAPWKTINCTVDLRPGGLFHAMMESPEGQQFPCNGCYLEVVENKKLVWSDALGPDFRPSENPFMTAVITFEAHGKGTKYTAIALHKDQAARKKHEEMGFVKGWNTALDQLIAHIKG